MIEAIHDAVLMNVVAPIIPEGILSGLLGLLGGYCAMHRSSPIVKMKRLEYIFGCLAILMVAVLAGAVKDYALTGAAHPSYLISHMLHLATLVALGWSMTAFAAARVNDAGEKDPMVSIVGLYPMMALVFALRPSATRSSGHGIRSAAWKTYAYILMVIIPLLLSALVAGKNSEINSGKGGPAVDASIQKVAEMQIAAYGLDAYASRLVQKITSNGGKAELINDRIRIFTGQNIGPEYFTNQTFPVLVNMACNDPNYGVYLKTPGSFPIEFAGVGEATGKFIRVVGELCE